ncbi:hypothetical protein [Streptomyces sp. NPDC126514]|uniref:hypothetical protein n=1 Tax=Streptomyces sp. NPDC126514 TaxID=3155210 RepID=UPI0033276E8C
MAVLINGEEGPVRCLAVPLVDVDVREEQPGFSTDIASPTTYLGALALRTGVAAAVLSVTALLLTWYSE